MNRRVTKYDPRDGYVTRDLDMDLDGGRIKRASVTRGGNVERYFD